MALKTKYTVSNFKPSKEKVLAKVKKKLDLNKISNLSKKATTD